MKQLKGIKSVNIKDFMRNIVRNHNYLFSLLGLIIVGSIANPNFLRITNVMTLMRASSILGILALGMTMVILLGQIDLSVGSMLALTGALAVIVYNNTASIVLTLLFCLGFGFVLGLFNGLFVGKLGIAGFVVSLATTAGYRSLTIQVGKGGPLVVNSDIFYGHIREIGYGKTLGVPNLVIIFVITTVLVWILLTKTRLGRYIYATGSNAKAARLTGVKTDWIHIIVFGFSGMLAGLAAFLFRCQEVVALFKEHSLDRLF